jgi:high frequency lysogenization protein
MSQFTQQERDRTIALAAIMQVVYLVHKIATTGQADDDEVATLLNSLLVNDAKTTEAVYGDLSKLRTGIKQLRIQLTENKSPDEITQLQYAVNLLKLERQLEKYAPMADLLTREIDQMPEQVEYYESITHDQVIARFADIYKKTISNITPFIEVHGEARYLTVPHYASLIRALLLAGIRAAVLWRQKGGRRWQFIFQSKKITRLTEALQLELQERFPT